MTDPTVALVLVTVLLLANLGLLLALFFRRPAGPDLSSLTPVLDALGSDLRRIEPALRAEFGASREADEVRATRLRTELSEALGATRIELARTLSESRTEARTSQTAFQQSLTEAFSAASAGQRAALETAAAADRESLAALRTTLDTALRNASAADDARAVRLRTELGDAFGAVRAETRQSLADSRATLAELQKSGAEQQRSALADFAQRLAALDQNLTSSQDRVRAAVESRLTELAQQNAAKLDEMRRTVDEKLQSTLERRLTESFKLVGENLERVQRGLGEMQQLATGVGDLKRVLSNVRVRGTWGEVQLGALLSQVLAPHQYATNVAVTPGATERVEFALRLPGPGGQPDSAPVWLPIDSKFPLDAYQALADAADRGDAAAVDSAGTALENALVLQARTIASKYVQPPHTTDFALLFLPTESLYAEVVRRPGLAQRLQQGHRIVVAGPSTLTALLNSLQMGFRTLAIQQRADEVWKVLGAVKTEFGKFGDVLERVQKKLGEASDAIDKSQVRTRAIARKLRQVEELPAEDAAALLPPAEDGGDETDAPPPGED